jgi:hypothetical protein
MVDIRKKHLSFILGRKMRPAGSRSDCLLVRAGLKTTANKINRGAGGIASMLIDSSSKQPPWAKNGLFSTIHWHKSYPMGSFQPVQKESGADDVDYFQKSFREERTDEKKARFLAKRRGRRVLDGPVLHR